MQGKPCPGRAQRAFLMIIHISISTVFNLGHRPQVDVFTDCSTLGSSSYRTCGAIMGMKTFLLVCISVSLFFQLSSTGLVRKIIRHRREALMPKKSQENLTLPHPDQPVVFNHVYNINVPSTSLCSVDLDLPGGPEVKHKTPLKEMQNMENVEHTEDGDNQIVFTHRITIPKQACNCENQPLDVKSILNRLEMLELELSSLREQCTAGAGCCGAQVTGNFKPSEQRWTVIL